MKMDTNIDLLPAIKIERPLYENEQLRNDLNYVKIKKNFSEKYCKSNLTFKKLITNVVPAIGWLSKYEWKSDFFNDFAAGFTVAIMHIPQGMAYALLGNLPPVVGIYMAVFPVLVYFFFGTSRHVSMGTFSISCLMTGKAVLEYSHPSFFKVSPLSNNTIMENNLTETTVMYTPIQVACTVTLVAAFVQLIMYFLRLGAVSALLSEMLVNAFTAGAACQIVVTQIKDILGLKLPSVKGNFLTVKTLTVVFQNLSTANYASIVISAITMIILVINNELLKPLVAKKSQIPVPIELIAVVVGALVSQQINLPGTYALTTVGEIPSGFPDIALPPISLVPSVLIDGFSTAIVCYVTSMSLALILAQKANYEVDANQELLAIGASNVVGSMFSCMPMCASLSRSMIQQIVGGKTQLVSIFSAALLVVILLWVGPFFEPLPKCVLASVIVISLKGMLMQIADVVKFWKLSKLDATVWIVTFLTVVFVSMEIGLLVGVCMSLFSIFIFTFKPYTSLLGSVPNTDLYLDIKRYQGIKEIEFIKIFHYCGGINFATKNIFREEMYKLIELNSEKELVTQAKLIKLEEKVKKGRKDVLEDKIIKLKSRINKPKVKCLIMDFSSVSYIDPSGAVTLKREIHNFNKLSILLYIAACSDRVYNMLEKCDIISKEKDSLRLFPSVHDAVQCAAYNLHIRLENGISTIIQQQ